MVAFVLSAAGVFSVLSYDIRRRTREMGIRKAVGAEERDLQRLVLVGTLRQTSIGIGIGLVAALGTTRFLGELLYAVEPMDGMTTAVAMFVLVAAALVASYIFQFRR